MRMLRALVPFAAGIVVGEYYDLPVWFLALSFVLTGAVALLLRSSACMAAMLFAAGFGAAELRTEHPTVPLDAATVFEIVVSDFPAERGAYRTVEGRVEAWRDPRDGGWYASGDRIVVRADSLTPLAVGERICCRGRIRPLRGGSESYRRLMRSRGYVGSLYLTEKTILERRAEKPGGLHVAAVGRLRRLGLSPAADALVRAMTAGDRSAVSIRQREAFSRSGLSHLLAVSGLHTGIVFLAINLLLWWMPLLRRGHLLRNLVATVVVWCFVAAAGFPPSAVRAGVMCMLLQLALASSSEYSALNALAAAAFGMLLWNPAWAGDVSFRLSFAAVAGILAWGVPLCRRCRTGLRLPDMAIGAYLVGLTATVATAPLVAHTFGILPVAGLAINPAAIVLAGAAVVCGAVWTVVPIEALRPGFAYVAEHAAEGIDLLARAVADLPGGAVEWHPSGTTTAGIYLFFVVATLAAWSVEPKKSVTLSS